LKDENEASTVGGPFEIVDTLGDVGELLRFAAAAIEEPDLIFTTVARGAEGEIFSVGAPARVAGGDAFGGEGDGIAAMNGDRQRRCSFLSSLSIRVRTP